MIPLRADANGTPNFITRALCVDRSRARPQPIPTLKILCLKWLTDHHWNSTVENNFCHTLLYDIRTSMANRIVDIANNNSGYIYGGYVRDCVAGIDFRDIDVCFPGLDLVESFVKNLNRYYSVKFESSKFYNCYTICVHHRRIDRISISIDISLANRPYDESWRADFDINMLRLRNGVIEVVPHLAIEMSAILENCRQKQFTVLDAQGTCTIKHLDKSQCINRTTKAGKILVERIQKMLDRGWKMLNYRCQNPVCILATARKYHNYLLERQAAIRDRYIPTYIPGFVAPKLANTISFEHKYRAKKMEIAKCDKSRERKKKTKDVPPKMKKNHHCQKHQLAE